MFILQPPSTVWSTQTVILEGVQFIFEYQWNTREEVWVLNIYDETETLVIGGIRLVVSVGLLSNYTSPQFPKGNLVLVDTESEPTKGTVRPDVDSFGTRFILVYYESTELG